MTEMTSTTKDVVIEMGEKPPAVQLVFDKVSIDVEVKSGSMFKKQVKQKRI